MHDILTRNTKLFRASDRQGRERGTLNGDVKRDNEHIYPSV